ncbi:hypothetical protein PAXINDRAFT_16754 [Paxillus involutus ATCC 200175]|uniref:MFS general substrate transporter n=1 Tax=Paxillus involutus ATCC 200175 TaxID=664439 RepID=A0A0C9TR57_PAXIN|nr:hypothetical protein PAXINDRAFT_16754 [Paxillus involutus ATCC 200175]
MQEQIQDYFETTNFIATLGVGLYNFGAIFGPLIGAPLSELYGRWPVCIGVSVSFIIFSCLQQFGSLLDMFTLDARSTRLFTIMLQGAPTIGPVPSSLLVITAVVICLPETEATVIWRRLAKDQGDIMPKISTPAEQTKNVWSKALLTPIVMFCCKPIVFWTAAYHAFVYGLLFLLLEACPHICNSHYSMSRQEAGLVCIASFLGNLLGILIYFFFLKPQYEAQQRAIFVQSGGKREITPEASLPGVTFASLFTPVSMLWFAFSAHPDVHWFLPVLLDVPVGMDMTLLQLSLFNYYIDLYPTRSASVIAVNTAVRNLVSTIFPSIWVPLYNYLGTHNASLLLACIRCAGFPTGIVLLVYGKRLQAVSRWAKQDVVHVPDMTFPSCLDVVAPLLGQLPKNTWWNFLSPGTRPHNLISLTKNGPDPGGQP